jgi:hypothetical protein
MLFDAGSIVAYVLPTGSGINNSAPYRPGSYTLAYATSGPSSVETETAGIQEALDFVSGRGGGTIKLYGGPKYTYGIDATIDPPEGVSILGDGCTIAGLTTSVDPVIGNMTSETLTMLNFKDFSVTGKGNIRCIHVYNCQYTNWDIWNLEGNSTAGSEGFLLDAGTVQNSGHNRIYVRQGQGFDNGFHFLGTSSHPTTLNEYGGEIYGIAASFVLIDAYADTNWGTRLRTQLKTDAIGFNFCPNGSSSTGSNSQRQRVLELACDLSGSDTGQYGVQIGFGGIAATDPSLVRIDGLTRGGIAGHWAGAVNDTRGADAAVDYFIADLNSQTMYRPSWWY